MLSQALLAQHVPPSPMFSGEGDGVEGSFLEWQEQLELVASMCKWSDPMKLINVATRLKGAAYAFYRSCTSTERVSYPLLAEQLSKRFTPVHIPSVQSSHDRKQGQGETVDSYAQELRSLFRKAYPPAQMGSEKAEAMGHTVLANQFVSGLCPELKSKLAGQEGSFDELLARAHFEEAKQRDVCGEGDRRSGSNFRSFSRDSERRSSSRNFCVTGMRPAEGPTPGRQADWGFTGRPSINSEHRKKCLTAVLHVWSNGTCTKELSRPCPSWIKRVKGYRTEPCCCDCFYRTRG